MFRLLAGPILCAVLVGAAVAQVSSDKAEPANRLPAAATGEAAMQKSPKILRHVVLFGFKQEDGASVATEAVSRLSALRETVPGVVSFEYGVNSSPEKLNKGLTHCFIFSFASEKDRDQYLVHPNHLAFTSWVGPHLSAVTVVDYWIE